MATITSSEKLYSFFLQQVAAESYIEGPLTSSAVSDALQKGSNRKDLRHPFNDGFKGYTRLTAPQRVEFLQKFKVAHQFSDDPTGITPRPTPGSAGYITDAQGDQILANTGLSATLINVLDATGRETNEFTLSIRSTEFRSWADGGDNERDNQGANVGGIVQSGFALAQQVALEKYYDWLKRDNKLPPGASLNVTGYSLGGNLATVFTELHQDDTDIRFGETVTFNGAGRGTLIGGAANLEPMLAYFQNVLATPAAASVGTSGPGYLYELRAQAIGMVGQPFNEQNLYADPRYQWAREATQTQFGLSSQALSDPARTGTSADDLITQVYGFETERNTDVTANSGTHGPTVRVGLESQPLLEGAGSAFGNGDFGNGHSISLIGDSLALQRELVKLDPSVTLEKFIPLLSGATNLKTKNGANANYEYNALENILDGLRRSVFGVTTLPTDVRQGTGGFGDLATREKYFANLKALTENSTFKDLTGKVSLVLSTDLSGTARTDFGAIAALQTLSPVALIANGANSSDAESVWASSGFAAEFTKWKADQSLSAADRAAGLLNYTDTWINDRSALLSWKDYINLKNIDPAATGNWITGVAVNGPIQFEDRKTGTAFGVNTIRLGVDAYNVQRVRFGADDGKDLNGADSFDRLYGGTGNDAIDGKEGADWLEGRDGIDTLIGGTGIDTLIGGDGSDTLTGGKDNDILLGGKDFDTYVIDTGDGIDIITDSDGSGKIMLGGIELVSAGIEFKTGNVWRNAEQNVSYYLKAETTGGNTLTIVSTASAAAPITTRVQNFINGALGIMLPGAPDAVAPATTTRTITGDQKPVEFAADANGSIYRADDLGNVIVAGDEAGRDDYLRGSTGNDLIQGKAGEDNLFGLAGNDIMSGGSGASIDNLYGGDGDDVLIDGDVLGTFDYVAAVQAAKDASHVQGSAFKGDFLSGGNGNDTLIGSDRSDRLLGGSGKDTIIAGAGDDYISGDAGNRVNPSYVDWSVTPVPGFPFDFSDQTATIQGEPDNDVQDDTIYAGSGIDHVVGGNGNDVIFGEEDDDFLAGNDGNDTILGGDGNDEISGDRGQSEILAGQPLPTGNDFLDGGAGNDKLYGDTGNDILFGGDGIDRLEGDNDTDIGGNDYLDGGAGGDTLIGSGGNDILVGGEGDDVLGGDSDFVPVAQQGNDELYGGAGADVLQGDGGNDLLDGGDGKDVIGVPANSRPGAASRLKVSVKARQCLSYAESTCWPAPHRTHQPDAANDACWRNAA